MTLTLPTVLTLGRIALVPVLVLVFYLPVAWAGPAAAIAFTVAAATDWLDGYLARRLGQQSAFGAFLDPVADKIMVAIVLIMLVQDNPAVWVALPAMVIISREIVISALREWMAEIGQRAHVAVSLLGKGKTAVQMVALILMLWRQPVFDLPTYTIGVALLYAAALLTLYSMVEYLRAAWRAGQGAVAGP
ncbi:MAG: CDP-diacylglycerol--glycerol-3-phosphate 3-phosphatidyltransferase [Guyparkeria sp.]